MRDAPDRIAFLDGVRGIAAVQVVLLHYVTAFDPAMGLLRSDLATRPYQYYFINTPLSFLFDGYMSVYIFFLLSGVALTHSFERAPFSVEAHVLRRIIRLGLPMAASVLLAFLILPPMYDFHLKAARISGSVEWMGSMLPPVSFKSALFQTLTSGMFAGYSGISLFPDLFSRFVNLVPMQQSMNPPLWTLHLELVGSLEVLLLVAVRAALGKRPHAIVCAVTMLVVGFKPLSLFVVGHLVARMLTSKPWRGFAERPSVKTIAIVSILSGIACSSHHFGFIYRAFEAFLDYLRIKSDDEFHNYEIAGSLLVFFGLISLPRLWRPLEYRGLLLLGRLSFSLYLTHFPILLTVSCGLYLLTQGTGVAAWSASIVGIGLSFIVAFAFERWVDRPAVRLSRRVGAGFDPKQIEGHR